jgi:antitoxin ParD1/3/4
MTTRNVSLTTTLEHYVADRVRSGEFQNASEVVRDALRLHKARTEEDAIKLERLNRLIQEGIDAVEAGDYEEVEDLGAWFDALEAEPRRRESPAHWSCAARYLRDTRRERGAVRS